MDLDKALEAAARALCRHDGLPENTQHQGRRMWESFLPEAYAAITAALPHLQQDAENKKSASPVP